MPSQAFSRSKTRSVSTLHLNLTSLETALVIEKEADLTIWYIIGGIVGVVVVPASIIFFIGHKKEKKTNIHAKEERERGVARWGTKTSFATELEDESNMDDTSKT